MSKFHVFCQAVADATGSVAKFDHMDGGNACLITTTPPLPPNWILIHECVPWGEQLNRWRQQYAAQQAQAA